MSTRFPIAILAILVCSFAGSLAAADQPAAKPPEWMALLQPGPEHQQLAKLAGTWDVACKMWMEPSKPPMESKGTSTDTVIFDGRFVRQDFKGEMMGTPFTGLAYLGFDRVNKVYTSTWLDSMGTSISTMTGTASADGKTITYKGDMPCPQDGKNIPTRSVVTWTGADSYTFEMFATRDGKEAKGMELTYTRTK